MLQSATKILGNLINDMLDYAQLSAGNFRKLMKNFNLIESVEDVIKIMRFKADQFGIAIEVNFEKLIEDRAQIK